MGTDIFFALCDVPFVTVLLWGNCWEKQDFLIVFPYDWLA